MRKRVIAICGLLVVCCSAGCYERVVSAKGLGASRFNVQESGRSNTAADRAFDSLFQSESKPDSNRGWGASPGVPRNAMPKN
jgi:hypothetical protein